MRVILWTAALIAGAISGCASGAKRTPAGPDCYVSPLSPPANAQLIFDPAADYPLAANLTYRSDWPSAPAVVQGLERIAYRESIYDIQGLRGHSRDLTYRRFRAERVGDALR
jgi:hypothetical protein